MHVGIVACSPPGAALCFELIADGMRSLARASTTPTEISMHSHGLATYMRAIDGGHWDGVAQLMLSSARKLKRIGAHFLISPCNSIHHAFDLVAADSPLPWLHIAKEVALEAQRRGYRRIGLLGTSFMMEGPVYPHFLARCGIDLQVPEASQRRELNRLIFDEMVHGTFKDDTRREVLKLLGSMKAAGCDAVGLCCTELPLLLRGAESPVALLDSTRILAHAALQVIECSRPLHNKILRFSSERPQEVHNNEVP